MISSSKVERKGGLIIYQLNDVDDLSEDKEDTMIQTSTADPSTHPDQSLHHLEDLSEEMAEDTPSTIANKKITIVLDGANIGELRH